MGATTGLTTFTRLDRAAVAAPSTAGPDPWGEWPERVMHKRVKRGCAPIDGDGSCPNVAD